MSNFPFPEKIKIKKEGMQLWWNGVNASDTLEFKLEVMVRILPLKVVRNGYLYPIFFSLSPHFSRDIYKDSYFDQKKSGHEDTEGKEKN